MQKIKPHFKKIQSASHPKWERISSLFSEIFHKNSYNKCLVNGACLFARHLSHCNFFLHYSLLLQGNVTEIPGMSTSTPFLWRGSWKAHVQKHVNKLVFTLPIPSRFLWRKAVKFLNFLFSHLYLLLIHLRYSISDTSTALITTPKLLLLN